MMVSEHQQIYVTYFDFFDMKTIGFFILMSIMRYGANLFHAFRNSIFPDLEVLFSINDEPCPISRF